MVGMCHVYFKIKFNLLAVIETMGCLGKQDSELYLLLF